MKTFITFIFLSLLTLVVTPYKMIAFKNIQTYINIYISNVTETQIALH